MMFGRTIGIIGGMGPFAGSAMLERVLRVAAEVHGARENHEFPRVLLASTPVRDLVSDESADAAAIESVREEAALLVAAGASVLSLACVTMHAYLPSITRVVDGPVDGPGVEWVSLADVCVAEVLRRGFRRPLVLSSPTSARRNVLAGPLEARGVACIPLGRTAEPRLASTIRALVGGAPASALLPLVQELVLAGAESGADCVVLGCTELAPFASLPGLALPTIDLLDGAARALCLRAARA